MKIQFTVYTGHKEYSKIVEFAKNATKQDIEEVFNEWKAGLFYSFWEKIDASN